MLLRQLELPFEDVTVDLFTGETRTDEHFARNPDGRIPVLELDSGETIPESGAILLYLAEGTPLLPDDRLARARVHQWMLFEQNRIEGELGYARFLALSGRHERMPEVFANRVERGTDALRRPGPRPGRRRRAVRHRRRLHGGRHRAVRLRRLRG